jgi:hypothetical protein
MRPGVLWLVWLERQSVWPVPPPVAPMLLAARTGLKTRLRQEEFAPLKSFA